MEAEECCLNPKDFITFKTEIDLLCDDEVDIFQRWGILEDIQKTKVYYLIIALNITCCTCNITTEALNLSLSTKRASARKQTGPSV